MTNKSKNMESPMASEVTNIKQKRQRRNRDQKKEQKNKKKEIKKEVPKFVKIEIPKPEQNEQMSVLVSFSTKQEQYAVPGHEISVPETVTPKTLNEIIKQMLEASNFDGTPPKFDFLIGGLMLPDNSKLCSKLKDADYLNRESVIEIEFIEQVPPPQPEDSLAHDDWVGDVHCVDGWLLSGCYDNSIHIWKPKAMSEKRKQSDLSQNKSAHRLKISTAHKGQIDAVRWLPKFDGRFISGSMDQSVLMWQWNKACNKVECLYRYRGHTSPVLCLAVKANNEYFTSGSSDGEVRLWTTDNSNIVKDEEPAQKKSKSDVKKVPTKNCSHVTKAHSQKVMGMVWPTLTSLATCSYDHAVKLWDMERPMTATKTYMAPSACLTIDSSPFNNVFLVATIDTHIRMLDPREESLQLVKTYSHGKKFTTSVKWSPKNENHFVTGGVDSIVKLWDIRCTTAPLYEMKHEDKVLSVDYTTRGLVFSGGADCKIQMFST